MRKILLLVTGHAVTLVVREPIVYEYFELSMFFHSFISSGRKMKKGKSPGGDSLPIEISRAGGECALNKLLKIFNTVYITESVLKFINLHINEKYNGLYQQQ